MNTWKKVVVISVALLVAICFIGLTQYGYETATDSCGFVNGTCCDTDGIQHTGFSCVALYSFFGTINLLIIFCIACMAMAILICIAYPIQMVRSAMFEGMTPQHPANLTYSPSELLDRSSTSMV